MGVREGIGGGLGEGRGVRGRSAVEPNDLKVLQCYDLRNDTTRGTLLADGTTEAADGP